ncbi:MAG: TIGR02147 family protein [Chitinispirillaceae bacterium]|nr:TIGR02147 family protein [Chitinispirillaceae bacterium]
MSKNSRISIFQYVDYRFFLSDYFDRQKRAIRGFSFRSFAKKAGLSASLLKDILSHRQNLTTTAMNKYAAAMNLTAKEIYYFEALVGFNNATTNSEKNRFFGEMVRLRGRSAVKFLDMQQYEYFSEWYHAVVRELVTHNGMGCDAEAIASVIVPAVSVAKICKSIKLLKELGLIYEGPDGTWRAADKVVSSEYEVRSVALKNYHIGMLGRAADALENFTSEEREFQGLTISASGETLQRMKERIRTFTDELLAMAAAETGTAEEVYQINLQVFPFTRRNSRDDS